MKIALTVITALLLLSYGIYRWLDIQQFGRVPDENFARSPNFDPETGTFRNMVPGDMRKDMKLWPLLRAYVFGKEIRVPSAELPTVPPNFELFLKNDGRALKWIWLGHSTLYLNVRGTLVLVDPVFTSASPLSFMVKRFQSPLVSKENLPSPDVIVLSHDHYDHLDARTLRVFAGTSLRFLVPLGLGARLRGWGIKAEAIHELDWHESFSIQDVAFTAMPAQHFSGRGLFDANKTQWAGWMLAGAGLKIFYSGDSGYSEHFKLIGERYGPFDLAFMECGQYNSMWRYVHMLPEEVLQASKDIGAASLVPVHWGMFNLSLHDWFEPIERITKLATEAGLPVWQSRAGAVNLLDGIPTQDPWWREHPDFVKRVGKLPTP